MPQLAARLRMLQALSGSETQEALSAWLREHHRCEISQGTISNWMNDKVSGIAPEKFYVLNLVFQRFAATPSPESESILELDIHALGQRLGFTDKQVRAFVRGTPTRETPRRRKPQPFQALRARPEETELLFEDVRGAYLGHSYALRNDGRITVSLLLVEGFDLEEQLMHCRVKDAGRYEYRGLMTLMKNDLIYCLVEEALHRNELVQMYLTTCGTNEYQYLYGILSGISGECPDDVDPRMETLINCARTESGDGDFVLRASSEKFKAFCDEMQASHLEHRWLERFEELAPGDCD